MLKVMTLVGTRPELIKMSRVISELDECFNHILVHSGQNYDYELNQVFFDELAIRKPDFFLNVEPGAPAKVISQVIEKADQVFDEVKPDALMLYGDTNTCLAIIAAKRRKIPVFHMEAGNRCFDERVPEELNRKIVDHLSDINMVLTEHARRYLIMEGVKPETIIKVGSHMREVITFHTSDIARSTILTSLELEPKNYLVVSAHREENVDNKKSLLNLLDSLEALAEKYNYPVVVSVHPRTAARIEDLGDRAHNPLIRFLKPFGLFDYLKLQSDAFCVVSDSGTITEEASLLRFCAVTIRNAHERPEGMDSGTLVMSSLDRESVLDSVSLVTSQFASLSNGMAIVPDYDEELVSKKVARIVLSYVSYVRQTVWREYD